MAILIPSKNIYYKQNPKVRDNVIERIEVGAVEVVPANEYETTVYNKDLTIENVEKLENTINSYKDAVATNQGGSTIRNVRGACGLKYILHYVTIPEIYIPKVQRNKFISKIYKDKDENGNPQIKIGLRIRQSTFTGDSSYQPSTNTFDFSKSLSKKEEQTLYGLQDLEYKNDVSSSVSSLSISNPYSINSYHSIIEENNQLKINSYLYVNSNNNWSPSTITVDNSITANLQENDITVEEVTRDGIDCYKLSSVKVLIGVDTIFMSCLVESSSDFSNVGGYYRSVGTRILQECEELSITVYGNTIGIDLVDKTVYINGETAKKVHSVDGNELMQTSNYYRIDMNYVTGAIRKFFGETRDIYEKGKETATIRCSIGDYYDYDSKEKVISVDNSTGKMSFKMYDQVIPMVYGADRQDRPMSTYQDGSPKVFQVLGSNIYYDGAVWQELSLQEVDKSQIL